MIKEMLMVDDIWINFLSLLKIAFPGEIRIQE